MPRKWRFCVNAISELENIPVYANITTTNADVG